MLNNIDTAMILAAGRGSRLAPITDSIPKSLIPIRSKPILLLQLDKLHASGIKKVVINIHWLANSVIEFVSSLKFSGMKIVFSDEREYAQALGTGGGIGHALKLLDSELFLCVNADIDIDYEYQNLLNMTQCSMLLASCEDHDSDVGLDEENKLVKIGTGYKFTGISVQESVDFIDKPNNKSWCLWEGLLKEKVRNKQVHSELHEGYWNDIGTMERMLKAQEVQ